MYIVRKNVVVNLDQITCFKEMVRSTGNDLYSYSIIFNFPAVCKNGIKDCEIFEFPDVDSMSMAFIWIVIALKERKESVIYLDDKDLGVENGL